MPDREWMLNPTAIKAARACITIVYSELGIKLKLSHPNFIEMLKEYVELTDSSDLEAAYHRLIDYSGTEAHHFKANTESIGQSASRSRTIRSDITIEPARVDDDEFVIHKGKAYKRFINGQEFKGLYRGQARYT